MSGSWSPRSSIGEAIRKQRELARLPMRQLAAMVGISGPYLSQIERGLRSPSGDVLEAIADSLQTTADALLGAAGGDETDGGEPAVVLALRDDHRVTAAQREALIEMYSACVMATAIRRRHRGAPHDKG